MKKLISFLLIFSIVLSCGIVSAVHSVAKDTAPIPTVYISGQGGKLYNVKNDRSSGLIYPLTIDKNDIFNKAMSLNVPYATALATGNWDSWCDRFVEICTDIFSPIALDKNGNPLGENGAAAHNIHHNYVCENGEYELNAYPYNYDWRLDYEDVIDALHEHIIEVCNRTKTDKINLLGRCIGEDVVLAYINKYGTGYINKIVLYSGGLDSFELLGKIFTGDMSFDKDAIIRYLNNILDSADFADDETMTVVSELAGLIEDIYGIEKFVDILSTYYSEVYENVLPRILRETLGRYGSFWGLIGDEYYEDAKKFVFGGYEEEYAEIIKKIDYTHYNVVNKSREIINKCLDNGVEVYIVAKYGLQMLPVIDNTSVQSDSFLELSSATGGAVCSPVTGKLSDKYIKNAKKKGTDKYISADMQVDCSTAFLPDHTWCIKDCTHMNMPDCVNNLFAEIFSYDGYFTVFDNEKFPQYLLFDRKTQEIVPLTSENCNSNEEWQPKNVFQRIFAMIKALCDKVVKLFAGLIKK